MTQEVKAQLDSIFRSAINIVESIPEPYRVAAFRIAVERLLNASMYGSPKVEVPAVRPRSLNELLAKVNPKTHVETIVTICYYLEMLEERTAVSAQDIRSGYNKARRTPGKNLSRDISTCVEKGYLMSVEGGPGRGGLFQLTQTGIQFVKSRLSEP